MHIIWRMVLVVGLFSFVITVFRDIGISMIFNFDAFVIVIGGTVIALFIGFPMQRIRNTFGDVVSVYCAKQRDREAVIKDILEISRMYMRTNIRNVENKMNGIKNNFLRMGVNLLINNYTDRDISNIMEREKIQRLINRSFSQNLLRTVARLTPSFGLAGTVISLIKMFKHLESVEAIAPMMAVALMSTFYGVIIANLIMLPLCAKLKEESIEYEAMTNIVMEGVLAIKYLEHPLKIEARLRGSRDREIDPRTDMAQGAHPRVPAAMY